MRIFGGLGVLGDFEDLGGHGILGVLGNFGEFRDLGVWGIVSGLGFGGGRDWSWSGFGPLLGVGFGVI